MADNTERFCTYCGQRIGDTASFCPSCGAVLDGSRPAESAQQQQQQYAPNTGAPKPNVNKDVYTRLTIWSIVVAVTAIIFLFESVPMVIQFNSLAEQFTSNPSWPDIVKEFQSAGFDAQQALDLCVSIAKFVAISFLLGGIFGAVGAVCGFTKKMYVLGLIMYILMTVVTCWTVFGLIIGIIATVRFATTKPCFS